LHTQSTEFAAFAFNGDRDFTFMLSPSAALATVCAAQKAFINLDGTGQLGSIRKNRAGS
jgi:hypothetical protein